MLGPGWRHSAARRIGAESGFTLGVPRDGLPLCLAKASEWRRRSRRQVAGLCVCLWLCPCQVRCVRDAECGVISARPGFWYGMAAPVASLSLRAARVLVRVCERLPVRTSGIRCWRQRAPPARGRHAQPAARCHPPSPRGCRPPAAGGRLVQSAGAVQPRRRAASAEYGRGRRWVPCGSPHREQARAYWPQARAAGRGVRGTALAYWPRRRS
jgi:hypothetical protein